MAAGIYSTGTVSYLNGSSVVTGTGTAFVANVKAGYQLQGPNGTIYYVQAVNSDTSLTLTRPYQGASQTAQPFDIAPTGGVPLSLAERVQELIDEYADIALDAGQGLFQDGTLGAPGIGFKVDQDTGVRRPASNAIALTAGGVDQLDVRGGVASGAAVQSSATDITIGKLLKVDALGVGVNAAPVPSNNIDNIAAFGSYKLTTATINGSPALAGFPVSLGSVLFQHQQDAQNCVQDIVMQPSGDTITRIKDDGVWQPFSRGYNTRNLLGSVAMTNGIPTGSVFFRGANANGEYVRLADGTQFVYRTATVDLNTVDVQEFTHASSFTEVYSTTVSLTDLLGTQPVREDRFEAFAHMGKSASLLSVSLRGHSTYLTDEVITVKATTFGRWRSIT